MLRIWKIYLTVKKFFKSIRMISKLRMKVDLLGQVILITAIILLTLLESGLKWTNTLLIFLGVWQIVSAIHLLLVYRHIRRIHFLKAMLVLLISLPLWINLVGLYAYLPIAGVLIWYFIQTAKETRIVYNRPRSFWDL